MLAPKWAHLPLSGAGAALTGGRFNPPGQPALYLSATLETAVAEYEQSILVRPGTFCAYEVRRGRIANLIRRPDLADKVDLFCPWRSMWLEHARRPPTWELAQRLRDAGYHGAQVPSAARPGGENVVLWTWNEPRAPKVVVLDPLDDLPADQASWPTPPRRRRG